MSFVASCDKATVALFTNIIEIIIKIQQCPVKFLRIGKQVKGILGNEIKDGQSDRREHRYG